MGVDSDTTNNNKDPRGGPPGAYTMNNQEPDYSKLTHEIEVRILGDIVVEIGRGILNEPGVFEYLRETYNGLTMKVNEIITSEIIKMLTEGKIPWDKPFQGVAPRNIRGTGYRGINLLILIAHWTGHQDRLNRDIKNCFGDHKYSKEELIAELTAAFLCGRFKIEKSVIRNSAGYIQSWISELKSDPNLIIKSASMAQKSFDYLLEITGLDQIEETPEGVPETIENVA